MQSFRRQFYFAATITLILFGIAKSDYVKGFNILSDERDFVEMDEQYQQPATTREQPTVATESRDQESSHGTTAETEPPADSIDSAPAAVEQDRADSEPGTVEETRVDSTLRTIERDRTDSTPRVREQSRVDSTPTVKVKKVVYSAPVRGHNRTDRGLYTAITSKIGRPYRSGGTDDSGYDCSGFVWRVFQEAGIHFERSSARTYWQTLPEATEEEKSQFGTLVFFDNSSHVGIVLDANSFYHASTSKGVMRSNYSDYWGSHVIGFRRVRLPQDISMVR